MRRISLPDTFKCHPFGKLKASSEWVQTSFLSASQTNEESPVTESGDSSLALTTRTAIFRLHTKNSRSQMPRIPVQNDIPEKVFGGEDMNFTNLSDSFVRFVKFAPFVFDVSHFPRAFRFSRTRSSARPTAAARLWVKGG